MEKDDSNIQAEEQDSRQLAFSALKKIRETKDKNKRLRIVRSLCRSDTPWALDVLLDSLIDRSIEVRSYITRHLAGRKNLDLPPLYNRLSKPPWNVKLEVLKILGLRKDGQSIQHIGAVLEDTNVDVRKTAAEVLGLIGGKEATALLVQLAKDSNPFVRKAAEKSLLETSDLKFM